MAILWYCASKKMSISEQKYRCKYWSDYATMNFLQLQSAYLGYEHYWNHFRVANCTPSNI